MRWFRRKTGGDPRPVRSASWVQDVRRDGTVGLPRPMPDNVVIGWGEWTAMKSTAKRRAEELEQLRLELKQQRLALAYGAFLTGESRRAILSEYTTTEAEATMTRDLKAQQQLLAIRRATLLGASYTLNVKEVYPSTGGSAPTGLIIRANGGAKFLLQAAEIPQPDEPHGLGATVTATSDSGEERRYVRTKSAASPSPGGVAVVWLDVSGPFSGVYTPWNSITRFGQVQVLAEGVAEDLL